MDNRDSFVYNLAHRLSEVGAERVVVVRSDEVSAEEVLGWEPSAIVISPGPGHPREAGCAVELARSAMRDEVALLGVCLGHQAIVEACGGRIRSTGRPMHGESAWVEHNGAGIFKGLGRRAEVGRYHALAAIEPLPEALRVSARLEEDGMVMAVEHETGRAWGVQFHPESVLTPGGKAMLENFLRWAGLII